MKLLSRLTFSLVGFLLPFQLVFAQNHQWEEATSKGYTYRYVTNDPSGARFYTLQNGLTVILSPDHEKPRIQTYIAVKAGSKTDPADHTGLAHYLEHMLFKGTDKFGSLDWSKEKPYLDIIDHLYEQYNSTRDEATRKAIYHQIDSVSKEASKYAIANEYDKLMSNMGAKGTNAFTSFEQTVYTEDIPSSALDKYLAVQAERFRNPILRLFHTELEAVYEEKNRTLDNDGRKSFEAMFAALFPNNNYGKQTTIGTIEHLKNPSLLEIRAYFHTYYVPNNMGIIMSGDFDPDVVIAKIEKAFSYMQPKSIPPYIFEPEKAITQPVVKEVYGPNPENVMMGFRFPGASTEDARMLDLIGSILTNGSAGLLDLDLVKKQKLLYAYAFPYQLIDYSMLLLQGAPVQGQSLDEVKDLILGELDKLAKGEFSDALLTAIINNEKKDAIKANESYSNRASMLMDNFTSETDWKNQVSYVDYLSGITKKDVMAFAQKYLRKDNYVVVYKRQGEDKNVVKVDKPEITPVSINRTDQSAFLKQVNALPETEVSPVWLDFDRDIQKAQSGNYPVLAVKNTTNRLFDLTYYFEAGDWNNKLLSIAADYLEFIGTNNKSAEEVAQAFYQLATSFSVNTGNEQTYLTLSGLDENFEASVKLFDELLYHARGDEAALAAYKARLKKSRANNKENKAQIMSGLMNYALYGADNPFNYTLSDAEIDQLTAADLINTIRQLITSPYTILYYGPRSATEVAGQLQTWRKPDLPSKLVSLPTAHDFKPLTQEKNRVLFTHYDMVQAEVRWARNGDLYKPRLAPTISLFNEYFGGGMGTVVFQTIRESKALAYSTFAVYVQPNDVKKQNFLLAYVGTQADKFDQSLEAMNELLNDLPESKEGMANAKTALRKKMATDRITKNAILFAYLKAQREGIDYDLRKEVYKQIDGFTFNDLKAFHEANIAHKAYTYCVVADENQVSEEMLKKYGDLTKLSLEQVFGY